MKHLIPASLGFLLLAAPAHATVVQSSTLPGGPYTSPVPTTFTPDVFTNLTETSPGIYRSPFEGTSASGSPFTSIEGNGSATFDLSGNSFSLIWGSPDTYNSLSLFSGADGTGTKLATVTGSAIDPANGTGFSFVTLSNFGTFNSVVLNNSASPGTGSNAFEVSTFAVSSVPLPASLPMFGGALLALATVGAAYRKRNASARA